MANVWLRIRYPKQLRQFGDAIWSLRRDIEITPIADLARQGELNRRRNEIMLEIIKGPSSCRGVKQLRRYLRDAYGLPLHRILLPPRSLEDPRPIPAICPNCGSTEILNVTLGLWDGADQDGNEAHGISLRGNCQKCGEALEHFGDEPNSGNGQEWQKRR
jgi:hypothetical protein